MKALVYHGVEKVSVDEVEVPAVSDMKVLVKVEACGVCGTDKHIFEGAKGAADCKPPTILGHEFSGIVTEIGQGVEEYKVGDRVAIDPNCTCGECYFCASGKAHFCTDMVGTGTTEDGGFAEYCLVHKKQLVLIGDEISYEEAAMAEPVSCCLHGLDLLEIVPGDDVLVIGGGTIGQIMLKLSILNGAANIVMIEPDVRKRELATKNGACLTVDPFNKESINDMLQTFPRKFDKVIECVGSISTMEKSIAYAGKGSTVLLFGLTAPDAKLAVHPYHLFANEITVKSSFINPYTINRAVNYLLSGKLVVKDLISDIVHLEDAEKVFYDKTFKPLGKVIIRS